MDRKRLRTIIAHFASLDPNDDFGTEKCWSEMADILACDISQAILFFENECTDEEFYWLGPVFEDVAERTQSQNFVQVLRRRLSKVNPETYYQQNFESEYMRKWVDYNEYVRSIEEDIDYAEGQIKEQE